MGGEGLCGKSELEGRLDQLVGFQDVWQGEIRCGMEGVMGIRIGSGMA